MPAGFRRDAMLADAERLPFADGSFDCVVSLYALLHFPHPKRAVAEMLRVLKPGGFMRCQINGLPESAVRYDTWSGVRISSAELEEFCRANDFQMLSLEGTQTQYMWTTLRKRERGWYATAPKPERPVVIRRITNPQNSEPVAPAPTVIV